MATYYNEHDPKAAAWLRELIKEGHIPSGEVDERDIQDIKPHELVGFAQQHFFAGIGGWAYALRLAGWPDDRSVRTGSCPCQPFSAAGKGLGEKDERHLWPVFRDLITFGEPTITFGEQVASAAGRVWLARVRADMEALGYGVGAADLCSAGVGSPNIRQRLYWVADAGAPRRGALQRPIRADGRAAVEPDGQRDACGMADATSGRQRINGSASWSAGHTHECEQACRLGNADRAGSFARRQAAAAYGYGGAAESDGGFGRLGDADDTGSQGRRLRSVGNAGQRTPWETGTILLPCADGKARRIKPEIFPLADGVSGRVGLLRGAGNAINPWLAAEFIKACEEVLNQKP